MDSIFEVGPLWELIKKYSTNEPLTIVTPSEPGKKIRVIVSVKNKEGLPVANALIYLYQTDSRGWYAADAPHVLAYEGDIRHARLFGYVKTDKNGMFEIHTIKPSGYPQSDLPAHIHIHFTANGYKPYGTEFLFDDDKRLVGKIREDAIGNRFIIAKPEKTLTPFQQQFSYTIQLQKQ
jgi:protocatechuate 3,4-dioxygenase beta subunit